MSTLLPRFWRLLLNPILGPLISPSPVGCLIRQTAREQWRLLCVNLCGSLLEAFSEGATLAILFNAVKLLTGVPQGVGALNGFLAHFFSLPQFQPNVTFLLLLALAVLLQALQSLSRYSSQVANGYLAAHCRAKVTGLIHRQVLRLGFPSASHYKVGDLTDYASKGPEAINMQILQYGQLLLNGFLALAYVLVLVSLSAWLLLAASTMAWFITQVQRQLLPRLAHRAEMVTNSQVEISVRVTEDIQALRLLHTSGARKQAEISLGARLVELENALRRRTRIEEIVVPMANFLPVLAIAAIASLAVILFQARSSGVLPSLVTFVIALQRLNTRIAVISGTFNAMAINAPQLSRLNEFLSSEGKQFCREGGQAFRRLRENVRFERVSLSYSSDLPPAIREVTFTLPKGHMVALVGPSGAGKSSIADLLVGLYSPSAGRILIDGISLEDLDLISWQQHLGVVSQDTFLFNATLADNIAFGMKNVSFEEIENACIVAQAHGFIKDLPSGYQTIVGERGYRLSGGQRQRISLARAVLGKPEVLILDEATSALDSQSERLLQEAVNQFGKHQTILVIAHRLSTIISANQILVLESGQIVESGSHVSLLARDGLYAQLWKNQSQETNLPL